MKLFLLALIGIYSGAVSASRALLPQSIEKREAYLQVTYHLKDGKLDDTCIVIFSYDEKNESVKFYLDICTKKFIDVTSAEAAISKTVLENESAGIDLKEMLNSLSPLPQKVITYFEDFLCLSEINKNGDLCINKCQIRDNMTQNDFFLLSIPLASKNKNILTSVETRQILVDSSKYTRGYTKDDTLKGQKYVDELNQILTNGGTLVFYLSPFKQDIVISKYEIDEEGMIIGKKTFNENGNVSSQSSYYKFQLSINFGSFDSCD